MEKDAEKWRIAYADAEGSVFQEDFADNISASARVAAILRDDGALIWFSEITKDGEPS